jgi:translocation and assembly module TamA
MRLPCRLAAIAALSLAAAGAQAARVGSVEIRGLDEEMAENVRVSLALVDAIGEDLSERRLAWLLRGTEDEVREALQPFGYYSPEIDIRHSRDGDPVAVTITVAPGAPTTVRASNVAIAGEGGDDGYLRRDLERFRPRPGEVFDHRLYEASKARIGRRLAERGYFDADFSTRRVEVVRAERAADIDLVWDSGMRYDMGPISFEQQPPIVRESLLQRLVYWEQGSYYHEGKLDRLRESLARLDYFAGIDIQPRPREAVDRQVPVAVQLVPAPRSVYTAGLSYGTDSGAGVRLGTERRYVNERGHKALAQLDYAQKRKTLTLQYRVPAFAWLDGWYTVSAQAADEQTDYVDNRRVELVGSRSGQVNEHLTVVASLHALRERWAYVLPETPPDALPEYRYATFSYPSLRAEYIDADDRIFPRDALAGTLMLRGGVEGAGSDAGFAQLHATVRWYKGLGERDRLIARGEAGYTLTDALTVMPPTLRFFAGGDRSIRGYAWREVGPRVTTAAGEYAIGARKVVTGSLEYERYFNPSWGGAVFVDGGSAFNDSPDWRTGVGVGLRWRSPVGPVRLDLARGLDDPDSDFQIHLGIGAEF